MLRRRNAAQPFMNNAMAEPDDEDLMRAYANGDVAAFAALLQRYQNSIYTFLRRHTSNPSVAEDLLQETFLRVMRAAPRYQPQHRFRAWLYQIARNQCRDHFRAQARRPVEVTNSEPPSAPSWQSDPPNAADAIEHVQQRQRVMELLAQLSEEQREVLLLREYQDLSFNEIASIVGTSVGTVKSRMRYALAHLRSALRDSERPAASKENV
jgi:RNA polymerase sigma-70 factor (ECF subfamily)